MSEVCFKDGDEAVRFFIRMSIFCNFLNPDSENLKTAREWAAIVSHPPACGERNNLSAMILKF